MSIDNKRLERIEVKLDDTADHIGEIKVTLSAQRISLEEHIKRTNLLEDMILPIHKRVYMFQGALALIGILATIIGIYKALR